VPCLRALRGYPRAPRRAEKRRPPSPLHCRRTPPTLPSQHQTGRKSRHTDEKPNPAASAARRDSKEARKQEGQEGGLPAIGYNPASCAGRLYPRSVPSSADNRQCQSPAQPHLGARRSLARNAALRVPSLRLARRLSLARATGVNARARVYPALARSNAALRVPSLGSARRLVRAALAASRGRRKPRSLLNEACSLGFRLKHGLP
jgi:hypothetical protein